EEHELVKVEEHARNVAPISKARALDNGQRVRKCKSKGVLQPLAIKYNANTQTTRNITSHNSSNIPVPPRIKVSDDVLLIGTAYNSLVVTNEAVLQAIVKILLPSKHRVPALCLVIDGKKQKGSDRFDATGNQVRNFGANELETLDKILEVEDEEFLLNRRYVYWSKDLKKMMN
ncbi:35143_t:CDS:2, partial [Racocetra persica]